MQSSTNARQNPRWVRILVPIVVVIVISLKAVTAFGGAGLPAAEARDKAVETMRELDPALSISDWSCPDDSISIDKGKTTICTGTLSSLGQDVRQRFAIVGLGDDRYTIRLK